jgi:Flp pilus assembly protein TadB
MNPPHSPTEGAKRKSEKQFFSYSEAAFDALLIIVGAFLLAWLSLPAYASWIIVAACIVFILGARLFRLRLRNYYSRESRPQ